VLILANVVLSGAQRLVGMQTFLTSCSNDIMTSQKLPRNFGLWVLILANVDLWGVERLCLVAMFLLVMIE